MDGRLLTISLLLTWGEAIRSSGMGEAERVRGAKVSYDDGKPKFLRASDGTHVTVEYDRARIGQLGHSAMQELYFQRAFSVGYFNRQTSIKDGHPVWIKTNTGLCIKNIDETLAAEDCRHGHTEFVVEFVDKNEDDPEPEKLRYGDKIVLKTKDGKFVRTRNNANKSHMEDLVLSSGGGARLQAAQFIVEHAGGLGGAYSSDLPEARPGLMGNYESSMEALGACAAAVFNPKHEPIKLCAGWELHNFQQETFHNDIAIVSAVYTHESYPEHALVAYGGVKGTSRWSKLISEMSVPLGPCEEARAFFERLLYDGGMHRVKKWFVTGAGVGGFLAESVASWLNVPGVAFNSPGTLTSDVTDATRFSRPPFEVHLAMSDSITASYDGNAKLNHIAIPRWHAGSKNCQVTEFFNAC